MSWAWSRWFSAIQKAGRPKAGSVVGVPWMSPVAVPGFMARNMPGDTVLRAISSPRSSSR